MTKQEIPWKAVRNAEHVRHKPEVESLRFHLDYYQGVLLQMSGRNHCRFMAWKHLEAVPMSIRLQFLNF